MPALTPDLEWLIAVLILNLGLLALVCLLQPLVRDLTLGFAYTLSNFDERRAESKLGRRLAMVNGNQREALMLFAPLALIAWVAGVSHPHLSAIATAFLVARVTYAVVSTAGIPVARSAAWAVGFVATLYLGWIVWTGLGFA